MIAILIVLVIWFSVNEVVAKDGQNWPGFRGPSASGVVEGEPVPSTWDLQAGKNVKWKAGIPGLGHSSPIVWQDHIFLTTAVSGQSDPQLRLGLYGDIASVSDSTEHKWMVYALDRKTGRIIWERVAHQGVPKVKRHTKSTHANCTPATDGKRLVVFFGSEGLFCYDFSGKLLWSKNFGVLDSGFYIVPSAQWGFASSPIIYNDMVIVQCDVQKNSFVAAFDIKTGKERWRTARADVPTWSTPNVLKFKSGPQLILNGWKHMGGYDPRTGKEIWKLGGGGDIPVPTPIAAGGFILIANAHGRLAPLYAIRPDASGDISLQENQESNQFIAWSNLRNGAYMQTPIAYDERIYSARDNGVLNVYKIQTGEVVYQERLGGGRSGMSASPVASDKKIFFTAEDGTVFVLESGPEYKLLAENTLAESCMASPAISRGNIFFRTKGHLIAIGTN
jgi:outer membrane protein assembly factor BamB